MKNYFNTSSHRGHLYFRVNIILIKELSKYTIHYTTLRYTTLHYTTIQYNTIQYNTIQYNTISAFIKRLFLRMQYTLNTISMLKIDCKYTFLHVFFFIYICPSKFVNIYKICEHDQKHTFLSRLNVVQKETMWSLILYVVCT